MARKKKKQREQNVSLGMALFLLLFGIYLYYYLDGNLKTSVSNYASLKEVPPYQGEAYVTLNNNVPEFTEEEMVTTSFEKYSDLDYLGRAGIAYANIGKDIMPTEERGTLYVKPSGWHSVRYDHVDGKYLYNRCHLIAFQLAGENDNEKNLITCTRSMNTPVMTKFEQEVADYMKEHPNNHVLYRVTPIYEGENLLATGVIMEAKSVEDNGKGVQFHVFVYNVEEGVEIDYQTGDSKLST